MADESNLDGAFDKLKPWIEQIFTPGRRTEVPTPKLPVPPAGFDPETNTRTIVFNPEGPILITGATGQVGGALVTALATYGAILSPTRGELDLTSESSIRDYVRRYKPRWIINPAAYTAVDRAESESDLARAINAKAPRILGEEAASIGAPVIHFSTDYVFDGSSTRAYTEQDPTNPTSVYGATKLAGEQALAGSGATCIILRTSWVYSSTGKNFLLTILRLARERAAPGQPLKIVADQHGAPTSARELARATREIVLQCDLGAAIGGSLIDAMGNDTGVYHATASGETTWFGFAQEIVRLARIADPATDYADPIPIPSSEFPTPARRPLNSRLNCERLERDFGVTMLPWQQALAEVFAELPR